MADFVKRLNRLSKAMEWMPHKAASVAVNFSKERFVRKNWVDRSREKWQPRKRKDRGSILVRDADLKRSIRKLYVSRTHVIIAAGGNGIDYARIHNEGGTINKKVSVKAHTRKRRKRGGEYNVKAHKRNMNVTIPQRQFIGESALLMRRIERMAQREFEKALK